MADNVDITAGSGTPITTRQVSDNSHIQQVQLDIGTGTSKSAVTPSNPLPVKATRAKITATFTRPADTTTYAAGDVVANSTTAPTVITFSGVAGANGGYGRLLRVNMIDSANKATPGMFELWLFDTAPGLDNDNAAFTPTDAELQNLIDVIPLESNYIGDATADAGGNRVYTSGLLELPFKCGASVTAIYGELVVRNDYIPVSGESFYFIMDVIQE